MPNHADRTAVDSELERIAREATRAHPRNADFPKAVAIFRRMVERDPELIVALVGRAEMNRIEAAFVQQVQKSDLGRGLGEAQGRVPPSPAAASARERSRVLREDAHSILWTMMVGGKMLGVCTRGEVEKEAAESRRRADFLRALLAIMPADPAVAVKDAVTPKRADELWAGVSASPGKKAA